MSHGWVVLHTALHVDHALLLCGSRFRTPGLPVLRPNEV